MIPCSSIIGPKKFNFETAKSHLLKLIFKPKCASLSKTCNKWSWCSLMSRLAIRTSSILAKANGNPLNTTSMSLWKVWAALRNPNGILVNSKSPKGVLIAVFFLYLPLLLEFGSKLLPNLVLWRFWFLASPWRNRVDVGLDTYQELFLRWGSWYPHKVTIHLFLASEPYVAARSMDY